MVLLHAIFLIMSGCLAVCGGERIVDDGVNSSHDGFVLSYFFFFFIYKVHVIVPSSSAHPRILSNTPPPIDAAIHSPFEVHSGFQRFSYLSVAVAYSVADSVSQNKEDKLTMFWSAFSISCKSFPASIVSSIAPCIDSSFFLKYSFPLVGETIAGVRGAGTASTETMKVKATMQRANFMI